MYRILGELRAQYWYWFVRNGLINIELETAPAGKRAIKLELLKCDSTITHTYGDEKMGIELARLTGDQSLDKEFRNNGKNYRRGSRLVPDYLTKVLDKVIPGSLSAYQEGPCKLFLILESSNLVETMSVLARALLNMLESNRDIVQNDSVLAKLTDDLSNRCMLSIFGGSIKLLKVIEDIFEHLFPDNNWDEFTSVINMDNEQFDIDNLRHPKVIELELVVPIVIGFAFFRASYFDEIHYLSKVCYQEKYLKLLNHKFLMKEELWCFNTDAGKKIDSSRLNYNDSNIKGLFEQAKEMTTPASLSFAKTVMKASLE